MSGIAHVGLNGGLQKEAIGIEPHIQYPFWGIISNKQGCALFIAAILNVFATKCFLDFLGYPPVLWYISCHMVLNYPVGLGI